MIRSARNQARTPPAGLLTHPYLLLLTLFWAVLGVTAGLSIGAAGGGGGSVAQYGAMVARGDILVMGRAALRAAALNGLLLGLTLLTGYQRALAPVCAAAAAIKGFLLGLALMALGQALGLWGVALGLPAALLPALLVLAGLTNGLAWGWRLGSGQPGGELGRRAGLLAAAGTLLEGGMAPLLLRVAMLLLD